ncbi:type ISP restriction/modification enzyme [Bartonella apihabitans]|uniref:type ISP restriction/modification enzyme n=1 Tax=uncultured Bartonella sp. TaxID=104108 RepID=UPI0025ED1353|nr:type ISP restriction/modification enzyme [Bartonella apihabitans]WLT08140.1 type ISP restriction/modification enzyme [Bartonella apihabitans]
MDFLETTKPAAKLVTARFWQERASDIAKIVQSDIRQIAERLKNADKADIGAVFDEFSEFLGKDIESPPDKDDIVELLAQYLVSKPVLDILFSSSSTAEHNPLSVKAIRKIFNNFDDIRKSSHKESLEQFYQAVAERAKELEQKPQARQKFIAELYDRFFSRAFPKITDRLGIVYTPVEVVDFILHSVDDILRTEFNCSWGSHGVHILDPFTGTGIFIARLIECGLIKEEDLERVYKNELHANEVVLLAYFIAKLNIETAYQVKNGTPYRAFSGVHFCDTFVTSEKDKSRLVDSANSHDRQQSPKQLNFENARDLPDIRIIIGNPPYSTGQESANDDAANQKYPEIDRRIAETYLASTLTKGGKRSSYDSYIRAIRWASDYIGNCGIIGFVTNAGFVQSASADGMRKCLAEEFSNIYIFHLRGNARTSGTLRQKEGGNIFGVGSRAPVAISLLVKNPLAKQSGQIFFYDIGDYLDITQKLEKIKKLKSIAGLKDKWQKIVPDSYHDWLNQRDGCFSHFPAMGDKKNKQRLTIFKLYSSGVVSGRDAWVYNASKMKLLQNVQRMTEFYNQEIDRYSRFRKRFPDKAVNVRDFVKKDVKKFSWGGGNWQASFKKQIKETFSEDLTEISNVRPFTKSWHYRATRFNHSSYSMKDIFPAGASENLAICVSGNGKRGGFSVIMSNRITDFQFEDNGQCFPLYYYEKSDAGDKGKDCAKRSGFKRSHAITDEALKYYQTTYSDNHISKEDLFYYIYGILHSPDYRARFSDNLVKELPHIPPVKTLDDFKAFASAGRALGNLHVNYESVEKYPLKLVTKKKKLGTADFYVTKMRYGGRGKNKDRSVIHYNDKITITGIPLAAYDYIVNNKTAIDWVMERQSIRIDKTSGIVNDANDFACETMHNPAYPLELLLRTITVSLETMKIIRNLPELEI